MYPLAGEPPDVLAIQRLLLLSTASAVGVTKVPEILTGVAPLAPEGTVVVYVV
jgi:hypothetical protein